MRDDWRYVPVGKADFLLNRFQESPEDSWIDRIDGVPDPPERISGVEMLEVLPEKKRDIVFLHIWEGQTFAEISEKYNCSRQAIHQHYKAAIEMLRKAFPDLDSLEYKEA